MCYINFPGYFAWGVFVDWVFNMNRPMLSVLIVVITCSQICVIAQSQPLPWDATSLMVGSGNCASCHQNLVDAAGNNVSIDAHWRSTMMANSARDPFFLAKVSTEVARFPALRDVIEDKCANCHFGMAHEQAIADGAETHVLGDGFTNPDNPYHAIGMDGVSCALCHQIQPDGLGEAQTFSGGYVIDHETAKPERIIFGPYSDPLMNPMQMVSQYKPVLGEHLSESKLCASCHTLYTPTVNEAGEVIGEFPEQTIYLEWLSSAYADGVGDDDKSCQGCHMPRAEGGVRISSIPPHAPAREPFSQHQFVGGNVAMLQILRDNGAELGVTATNDQFNATIARTETQLQQASADIVIDEVLSGETLQVSLSVHSKVGHKFPAGFPSRRAWVHFTVQDANGAVVFESGKPLADGRIEGADSDEDVSNASFEPHYEVISQQDQAQIYEAVMRDANSNVTQTLLFADGYAKDNRIPPLGFDPSNVIDDIAPDRLTIRAEQNDFGNAYGNGADDVFYIIDWSGFSGPFTVEAELLYQSVSYPFIRDLMNYATPEATAILGYYESLSQKYVVCSTARMDGIIKESGIQDWLQR